MIVGGVVLVAVVGTAIFLRVRSSNQTPTTNPDTGTKLEPARDPLRRSTDLTTCRSFLQHVNALHEENPEQRPQALTSEQEAKLRAELGLSSAEFNELNSPTFTPLDGHHLEFCFLLRDAANHLPIQATGEAGTGKQLPPQEMALVAFEWMMRQVRLKRPARDEGEGWLLAMLNRERLPEEEDLELDKVGIWGVLVLRRGSGSSLERALLFLALLDQLGLDGCLVSNGDERQPRYWACGVRGDDNRVYLFDPRLGMPLPGPNGKGIATLDEVQRDPAVLGQLKFDDKLTYDITPEVAGRSELHLVSTLSALSPRMKYLQDIALVPEKDMQLKEEDRSRLSPIKVRLTDDPTETQIRFSKTQTGNGKPAVARHARWATGLLRRSLPPDEGGTDRGSRRLLLMLRMAPLNNFLLLLPNEAKRNLKDMHQLLSPPLDNLVRFYQTEFVEPILQPRKPRDLMLRGRIEEAVFDLGTLGQRMEAQRAMLEKDFDQEKLDEWFLKASKMHAEESKAERANNREAAQAARAELGQIWRAYEKPLYALVMGSMYGPRRVQSVYWRCLALHDQAERAHARALYGAETDELRLRRIEEASRLWSEVAGWWQSYLNDFIGAPDAPAVKLAHARALRGSAEIAALEAKETSDEIRKAALLKQAKEARQQELALWEEIAGEATDLPKIAALYQAKMLK